MFEINNIDNRVWFAYYISNEIIFLGNFDHNPFDTELQEALENMEFFNAI